jgi:SSS family solute:Na+ symporter
LTVRGILKMLLVGLTLSTAYTLVVLMTILCPKLCRRSSASWTLAATMGALAFWLMAPDRYRLLPHPIYFPWLVSLIAFFAVAWADRRRIDTVQAVSRRGHGA